MLRRLLAIMLAIVITIILVGFFLPRQFTIQRSLLIEQPPEVIFAVLNDMRHFNQWSPWYARDPDAGYRVEGPEQGVGSTLVWSDEDGSGAGRLQIVESRPFEAIDLQMELGDTEADTFYQLEPGSEGTRVTWGMRVEFGTFDLTGRYIGLMLPGMIGKDYREGLERLASYLEQAGGQVPEVPPVSADETLNSASDD